MIIKFSLKSFIIVILIVIIVGISTFLESELVNYSKEIVVGGKLYTVLDDIDVLTNTDTEVEIERFNRPSKEEPYKNPYSFKDFQNNKIFSNPEDVVLAYYGILQEASNMVGYSGGCGSIGYGVEPYPYAYNLFTKDKKSKLSLNQFIDSFKGIGHIALLKLKPITISNGEPNLKYYFVEIEVIGGKKMGSENEKSQGSGFFYYYGLITVEKTEDGYKINDVSYVAEDFLCAPEHGWFYLADAVVEIVYKDNLKVIDEIDKIEKVEDMTYIYASKGDKKYRFDFIRITNGYDILLQENIMENGQWKQVELLTDDWITLKFPSQLK